MAIILRKTEPIKTEPKKRDQNWMVISFSQLHGVVHVNTNTDFLLLIMCSSLTLHWQEHPSWLMAWLMFDRGVKDIATLATCCVQVVYDNEMSFVYLLVWFRSTDGINTKRRHVHRKIPMMNIWN